jgi:hypothetical protein
MIAFAIKSDPLWSADYLVSILEECGDVHGMLREVNKASASIVKCRAFQLACKHGVVEDAKRIAQIADEDADETFFVRDNSNLAFRLACVNGHLDTAQWMYKNHHGIIDIHVLNDYAFRVACENGHWESAKWVATLGMPCGSAIKHAFYDCCRQGHFQIVKWLVNDVGFDGHVVPCALSHSTLTVFEHGFWDACETNRLDIAQWLFGLGVIGLDGHRSRVWWFYRPEIIMWLYGLDSSREWDAAFMAAVHKSR